MVSVMRMVSVRMVLVCLSGGTGSDGADGVGGLRAGQGYVYGVADDEGVGEGMDFRRQLSLGCVPAQDQGCGKCQAQDGEDGGEGSVCCCSHSSGLLG